MSSIMRSFTRAPRARFLSSIGVQPRRFAHSSYGGNSTGFEQDLQSKNPKEKDEHPGPESPLDANQSGGKSQSSAQSGSSSSSSSEGAKPKISNPDTPAADKTSDVKSHNDEMANRSEKQGEK